MSLEQGPNPYILQTGHSLQPSVLQGTASGILSQQSAQHHHKSTPTMPPLSAYVNENRQGLDFKDYDMNAYWFIGHRSPSEEGGGRLDHRHCCSQLRNNFLNMHYSVFFPSALSTFSTWPSLTVVATLLTSPSMSIHSTVLNLRVTEIGQADHWSLCQIEVKYEAEVSPGWVQSLQSLQRVIYGRTCFQKELFSRACVCRGMARFSLTHYSYCIWVVFDFLVLWVISLIKPWEISYLYGSVTSRWGKAGETSH